MIKLSESLSKQVKRVLNIENNDDIFEYEQLASILELDISKGDLQFIEYFKNLESISLTTFPSFSSEDIVYLGNTLNKVKSLKIKEQNALFNLDLSSFTNLRDLCIIHNDNLVHMKGLNKLDRFTFYDNKDYEDIEKLAILIDENRDSLIQLDITYYFDIMRYLNDSYKDIRIIKNIKWVESVGLRKFVVHEYSDAEIESLLENVSYIVSKYVYVTDGDIEKFGTLYNWMINNIGFVNEDDPKDEDVSLVSNVAKVLNYRNGGRLSYAKAFQLILRYAGINSTIVYSMGAYDTIGFFNGQKVYSLLGESDYAILRVKLDDRYYYCDVAWDCMVNKYKFFDKLRLFLFSKDELRIRHKFVGEGNIDNTGSYHGDDCDEVIAFAEARITEADDMFYDIDRMNSYINGVDFNIKVIDKEMDSLKEQIDKTDIDSMDYKILFADLIKLEEEIDEEENNIIKYENQKKGIIDSYSDNLLRRYLNDNDRNKESLAKLKNKGYISQYLYDILEECL